MTESLHPTKCIGINKPNLRELLGETEQNRRERKARGKSEAQENQGERMTRNERPEQAVPGGEGK